MLTVNTENLGDRILEFDAGILVHALSYPYSYNPFYIDNLINVTRFCRENKKKIFSIPDYLVSREISREVQNYWTLIPLSPTSKGIGSLDPDDRDSVNVPDFIKKELSKDCSKIRLWFGGIYALDCVKNWLVCLCEKSFPDFSGIQE